MAKIGLQSLGSAESGHLRYGNALRDRFATSAGRRSRLRIVRANISAPVAKQSGCR